MYAAEVPPAFRGATYSDEAQMVNDDTGSPVPFLPAIDALTWRLFRLDRNRLYLGYGYDYGFLPLVNSPAYLSSVAIVSLTLGAGLWITSNGTALWRLDPGQTAQLDRPQYRMTLDLVRYGETCRVMDCVLPVMD